MVEADTKETIEEDVDKEEMDLTLVDEVVTKTDRTRATLTMYD